MQQRTCDMCQQKGFNNQEQDERGGEAEEGEVDDGGILCNV